MKTHYPDSFREQALVKVYSRGTQTIESIANELNISFHTLKTWMKTKKSTPIIAPSQRSRRPNDWSGAERLQALLDTQGLDDTARHRWCRERGIYPHHLQSWRDHFEQAQSNASASTHQQLKKLKDQQHRLERELKRKDKALAEAAALLVLQKKYQALWEDKDV